MPGQRSRKVHPVTDGAEPREQASSPRWAQVAPPRSLRREKQSEKQHLICCRIGDDVKVAQRIFKALDVEETKTISWAEFCLFVKHSYENVAALNNVSDDDNDGSRKSLARFRRMVLQTVVGDDALRLLLDRQNTTGEGAPCREFAGHGYVTKARRLFRRFDENDSGTINVDEFVHALRRLGFFPFNVEVHGQRLLLVERSCGCCTLQHPCRKWAIRTTFSQSFDFAIVAIVIVNTLVLAIENKTDPYLQQSDPSQFSTLNQIVFTSEALFTPIYVAEFVIKSVASGFVCGRDVYLSSGWNIFDFVLLIVGLVSLPFILISFFAADVLGQVSSLMILLRILRVLRPLRSISTLPQMRQLARTFFAAIFGLKEFALVMVALWVIFGGAFVDVLHHRLSRQCHSTTEEELLLSLGLFTNATSTSANFSDDKPFALPLWEVWTTDSSDRPCGTDEQALHHCFRNDGNNSVADDLCLSVDDLQFVTALRPEAANHTFVWRDDVFAYNERMNFGLTNFDNLGFAVLTLFQMTTLEGWIDVVYMLQDSYHDLGAFWLFFMFILICGVLMISLVLAVVVSVYEVESNRVLDTNTSSWSASPGSIIGMSGFRAVLSSMRFGVLGQWARRAKRRVSSHKRKLSLAKARTSRNGAMPVRARDDERKDNHGEGMPGRSETEAVAAPLAAATATRERRVRCCLKVVQWAHSSKYTTSLAVCIVLNLACMLTAAYDDDEYVTCADRRTGNISAPCSEIDRDYFICVSNLVFVCFFVIELLFRSTVIAGAKFMVGTCAGRKWTRHQEQRRLTAAGIAKTPSPTQVLRKSSSLEAADEPPANESSQRCCANLQERRCAWQLRVALHHDSSDVAAAELFKEAKVRTLDVVDAIVTAIAVVDAATSNMCTLTPSVGEVESSLSALRVLSLLRVVRVASSWRLLRVIFRFISQSLKELGSFCALFVVFLFLVALLGLELFSNKFHFDEEGFYVPWEPLVYNNTCPPHAPWHESRQYTVAESNFDSFSNALFSSFQITTGENWNAVMYAGIRSGGSFGPTYAIYFCAVVVVGQWLLLNLLVAIMLRHFDMDQLKPPSDRKTEESNSQQIAFSGQEPSFQKAMSSLVQGPSFQTVENVDSPSEPAHKHLAKYHSLGFQDHSEVVTSADETGSGALPMSSAEPRATKRGGVLPLTRRRLRRSMASFVLGTKMLTHLQKRRQWADEAWGALIVPAGLHQASRLGCCSENGVSCVVRLLGSRAFGIIRSFMAVSSTLVYCVFTPSAPNFGDSTINTLSNYFFAFAAVFFWVEIILQIIALRAGFFRIGWSYNNVLATSMLTVGCTGAFFGQGFELQQLEVCRCGLVLYIFQFLAKLPALRVTFGAIVKSMRAFVEATIFVLIILATFSIAFIAEYKGKLGYCEIDTLNSTGKSILVEDFGLSDGVIYYDFVQRGRVAATQPCNTTQTFIDVANQSRFSRNDCLTYGGTWTNPLPNFDSFFNSYMAMFHLSTTEGWVDLAHRCVAAVGQNQQPMAGFNESRTIAFAVYVFVGGLISTQIVVTVLIANFKLARAMESGMDDLTQTQYEWLGSMNWIATLELRSHMKPQSTGPCRSKLFHFVTHRHFNNTVNVLITLFILLCALEGIAPTNEDLLFGLGVFSGSITGFFVVETAARLAVFGSSYFVQWEQRVDKLRTIGAARSNCCRANNTRRRLNVANIVDVFSVCVCAVSFLIGVAETFFFQEDDLLLGASAIHTIAVTFRVLRILRAAHLLGAAPKLRQYLVTLGYSALAVANIGILYFTCINAAALIMRELLGFIAIDPSSVGGLDVHAHFQTWVREMSRAWWFISVVRHNQNFYCVGSFIHGCGTCNYGRGMVSNSLRHARHH